MNKKSKSKKVEYTEEEIFKMVPELRHMKEVMQSINEAARNVWTHIADEKTKD